jgi:hypothetical protein
MRYLVTSNNSEPFFTNWFDKENHWIEDVGMIVYDLVLRQYTNDGKNWIEIEIDRL